MCVCVGVCVCVCVRVCVCVYLLDLNEVINHSIVVSLTSDEVQKHRYIQELIFIRDRLFQDTNTADLAINLVAVQVVVAVVVSIFIRIFYLILILGIKLFDEFLQLCDAMASVDRDKTAKLLDPLRFLEVFLVVLEIHGAKRAE